MCCEYGLGAYNFNSLWVLKQQTPMKFSVKFINCDLLSYCLEKCCRRLPFLFINHVLVFIFPSTHQAQESFSIWVYIKVPDCNNFVFVVRKSFGTSFCTRQGCEFIRLLEPALILVTVGKYLILHSCCNLFFPGNVAAHFTNKMFGLSYM